MRYILIPIISLLFGFCGRPTKISPLVSAYQMDSLPNPPPLGCQFIFHGVFPNSTHMRPTFDTLYIDGRPFIFDTLTFKMKAAKPIHHKLPVHSGPMNKIKTI